MTEQQSELDLLKQRADDMGIGYHPKIGLEALKAKVNAKLEPKVDEAVLSKNALRNKLTSEAKPLVRVTIINNNRTKKEWKGE